MFNGRNARIALSQYGTALGIDYVLGNGVDDRLTLQVDSLNLITCILGCRVECNGQVQTCMQTFSEQRKAAFQCFLFHIIYFLLFLDLGLEGVDFALQGGYLAIHIGQLGI